MRIQHWQDVGSLLLGMWLVLSPFALGFAGAESLDNYRAWVVRHSVCRRGICHSILSGGMGRDPHRSGSGGSTLDGRLRVGIDFWLNRPEPGASDHR
jgi:hypothetical protein